VYYFFTTSSSRHREKGDTSRSLITYVVIRDNAIDQWLIAKFARQIHYEEICAPHSPPADRPNVACISRGMHIYRGACFQPFLYSAQPLPFEHNDCSSGRRLPYHPVGFSWPASKFNPPQWPGYCLPSG
jgi:hypothetical protein